MIALLQGRVRTAGGSLCGALDPQTEADLVIDSEDTF